MQSSASRKVIPIVPVQASEEDGSLYEAQKKIYPRSVSGIFSRWRWIFVALTQLVFYGLPWLEWGQRQAVLFDLGARRFYIFGLVLYPQDFIYLTGLLVISALSLFLFTAVAGRLWCGFACPQTVYTEIFLWIERKVEGDRGARMRLDGAPMSLEKLVKKWFKHILWIGLGLWTGFTFVGYFSPIRELGMEFLQTRMSSWEVFWVFFYGFATYGNAGFLREQVCKYMCPYARFQSAMFDKDTLIVSYDTARGEPRGARSRKAELSALCARFVRGLHPVRAGVPDRHRHPPGPAVRVHRLRRLRGCVRHGDGQDELSARADPVHHPERAGRRNGTPAGCGAACCARACSFTAVVLLALCVGLMASLIARTPLKVDVVRDRAALSRIVAGGKLENVYRLQIMNATEQPQRYRISATGLEGLAVSTEAQVEVGPAESRWVAVRLQVPYGSAAPGSHPIEFQIGDTAGDAHVAEKSVFLVPR